MKKYIPYIGVVLAVILIMGGLWVTRESDPYVSQPLPELPVPPLRELAEDRGIQVGAFASLKYLRERPYSEIIASEFEYAIVDGEPNWTFEDFTLRPTKDTFDFADMDQVFDFADENNLPVRVQHLLWGDEKWLPNWLKEGNFTPEELTGIIDNHIATVGAKYKGRVREYSVVNEAFSRKLVTGGNRDWWGERLGESYIDNAFVQARQADPNAVLILNDFGNETIGDISNLMYDYIKAAKARGVPIDALGMQMHIDATNAPPREKVVENMRRFADLGVKIYITELDVNMHGTTDDRETEDERQAQIYSDMVGACVDAGPDVCKNIGFLGLTDRQSWYNGLGIEDANPLMFNDDYSPKPAFFSVREALEQ
jgi:endo-1,4-beta-xylanase